MKVTHVKYMSSIIDCLCPYLEKSSDSKIILVLNRTATLLQKNNSELTANKFYDLFGLKTILIKLCSGPPACWGVSSTNFPTVVERLTKYQIKMPFLIGLILIKS